MSKVTERDLLIANIKRDVAKMLEHNCDDALWDVVDLTGFNINTYDITTAEVAAAIVALAGVINIRWLRHTAEAAAYYLETSLGRPELAQRMGDRASLLPRLQAARAVAS